MWAIDVLQNCNELFFSGTKILKILITLPISNVSAKIILSSLRHLKIWLRLTMSETRITNLTLLNIQT